MSLKFTSFITLIVHENQFSGQSPLMIVFKYFKTHKKCIKVHQDLEKKTYVSLHVGLLHGRSVASIYLIVFYTSVPTEIETCDLIDLIGLFNLGFDLEY